jgi:hypothetical protein
VLDGMTLAEFHAVWMGGGTARRVHDSSLVKKTINEKRAAKGLPPMKPAKQLTLEERRKVRRQHAAQQGQADGKR